MAEFPFSNHKSALVRVFRSKYLPVLLSQQSRTPSNGDQKAQES